MTTSKPNRYWGLLIILLVATAVAGGLVVWSRYSRSQPIEVSLPPAPELRGEVYVGGAVNNPGFYPWKAGDSLEALILAAGGTTSTADLSHLKVLIPRGGEETQPQKVDLNRAEAWLLKALPGIGEARAQAIIDYRNQKGLFRNINELVKVEGLGVTIYEQIKHLITVGD